MIRNEKNSAKGFALVVTLTMMVLLTVIAVGLLSLSSITLRTASQNSAQAEAQANARMALMIAIGELQKQMGPDQRISANSAILDDSTVTHSNWLGVWDSWKAGVGEASQHSTIDGIADQMAPTYLPNRSDYFRKWLVSLTEDEMSNIESPKNLTLNASPMPGSDDDAIFLVADGSLGTDAGKVPDYVAARILDIKDKGNSEVTGRYGWWIGDESQKARLMDDSYLPSPTAPALTAAEKIYRSAAPASMGTKTISGLENMADDAQLAALPSLATLDLVTGAVGRPAQQNFHDTTPFSYSILTDVREGGLKRDLSTILEQPILRTDNGPEYMLYEFDDSRFPDDRSNSRVPIQDLAAYYQLYNDIKPADAANYGVSGREGVHYTSTQLANAIQVNSPDYDGGGVRNRQRLLREYTSLYKQPVITKVQFLVAVGAQEISPETRAIIQDRYERSNGLKDPAITGGREYVPNNLRPTDTHKLKLGVMPMVTLWNPNNVSVVMNNAQLMRHFTPPFAIKWRKHRSDTDSFDYSWFNLAYVGESNTAGGGSSGQASGFDLLRLGFCRTTMPIAERTVVFEPGEVKVFSIPPTAGGTLQTFGQGFSLLNQGQVKDVINGWDPYGILQMRNSTPKNSGTPEVYDFHGTSNGNQSEESMVFGTDDRISFSIHTDSRTDGRGRQIAEGAGIAGAGFFISMIDLDYESPWQERTNFLMHRVMIGRHGGRSGNPARQQVSDFYRDLMTPGFPGGVAPVEFTSYANAIQCSDLIGASLIGEAKGVLDFSLSLGCESGANSAGGMGGGRRIASRPFLHSALGACPLIDQDNKTSLYNYGWDWQVNVINNIEDSVVTGKPGTNNGFFGGGYTIEHGTTHVVQREIPVLPLISIAALSHAHLGGFSLGYANTMGDAPETDRLGTHGDDPTRLPNPRGTDYQKTSATGLGGLAPHVVQATGNSYAHPNIPANLAFTTWTRRFDEDTGEGDKVVPFVDHSYLANKALWDEFYFSSIAPQPAKVPLFGGTDRTTKQVADDFFKLDSPLSSSPLPNRRIKPYTSNLNQSKLDTLFTEAGIYTNGLADKLAAHLMVEGAFNVNSTSVEAWKIFLSSLKGKPVAYLDGGTTPQEVTPAGTTISSSSLPNDEPVKSADITDINAPEEQWTAGRELTEDEIDELATAMVKQVKLRGPFLSMSEFVNRRLEGDTGAAAERSVKGALQAALDDPNVTINANFRTPGRLLDSETASIPFEFPDAAKGPVAYGSMAYVDQADVLRGFAEQLTPRGDTFVIRTYGDSLDSTGKVVARAWCEAVVQRVPEYLDSLDESHVKSANLDSNNNRIFGRKIQIVSFRWLNPSEI